MSRVGALVKGRDGMLQAGVVLAAVGAYEAARMLIGPNWSEAFANARTVVDVERVTGLAWERPCLT